MGNDEKILAALEGLGTQSADEYAADASILPTGRRHCPICQSLMRSEEYRSVTLDVCPAHGMWLDNGELMALLARSDRLSASSQAIAQARRDGKISGALFGAWSILFD